MKRIVIMFLLFVPTFSTLASDDELSVALVGTKTPGLFDDEIPGPYNVVLDRITAKYDGPFKIIWEHRRRAFRDFQANSIDCLFVSAGRDNSFANFGVPRKALIFSSSVNRVTMKIYTLAEDAIVEDMAFLKTQTLALDGGAISVDTAVNQFGLTREKLLPTESLTQAFNLLMLGRVEGVLTFDNDYANWRVRTSNFNKYHTSESFEIDSNEDSIVCKRSPATVAFIRHVNAAITELKTTNELAQILAGKSATNK